VVTLWTAPPIAAIKVKPGPHNPVTIRVPADQPTIQAGIDAALTGDTVLVADGVYRGVGNRDIDFKGKAITVKSENGAFTTIVDCERFGRGFQFRTGETGQSKLIGFTIENGQQPLGGGGAILTVSTSPVISRCILRGNRANTGAGAFFAGGSPTIMNSMIVENDAFLDSFREGGGIRCQHSDAMILNCTIANNHATDDGGGVFVTGSTSDVTIENSILWGNTGGFGSPLDQISVQSSNSLAVAYSDVEGGQAGVDMGSGTLTWGAGNIDDDPRFLNVAGGDFHLDNDSPCIENGDPLFVAPGANAADVDGDARIFGTFVDMGADEFASCGSVFRQYFPLSGSLAIPDNTIGGLLVSIDVPEFGVSNGPVGVFIDVTHPDPDELLLVLYPPGCGPGDSCGLIFCGLVGSCPFPAFFTLGNFFDGVPIHGTWTLQIIDREAGDVGTLNVFRFDLLFSLCP
jgi:hypothetical protein